MIKTFRIDGLRYALHISGNGEIALELLGGATRKGSANRSCRDLFWGTPNFDDVDLGADALKLVRVVSGLLLDYAFRERPWRMGFSASTGRKVPIYRWLAARFARKLTGYNLVEFPEGVFNFYRLSNTGLAA